MRTKSGMMGICSIEILKLWFGSLMNTSRSNIRCMPTMPNGNSRFKNWSWPSKFMKIILGNVNETSTVYLEVSSMTW
jgi:hypothetical protein